MEKLSLDPCWLVLAPQTQPALCAVWTVTSSKFYSRKSFLEQLQSECQKILSWYANKEIISHRKDFFLPTGELKFVLPVRTISSPSPACVTWQVLLPSSDNLGSVLLWDSLFCKMAFAELLLKSQLKEVTVSSLHRPIKHLSERRTTAGRLRWSLITSAHPPGL